MSIKLKDIVIEPQHNYCNTESLPTPPKGFRLLKDGEIVPEGYIYYHSNKWSFATGNYNVGKKFDQKAYNPNIAISIFEELSDNLLLISAEIKREVHDNTFAIAQMDVEDLAKVLFELVVSGDLYKNVTQNSYIPFRHAVEFEKILDKKNEEIAELKTKLKVNPMFQDFLEPNEKDF